MGSHAESIENYLKNVYELALDHRPVKPSRIAEAMDVSPASVTEMLKRLHSQKMVKYQPYKGVDLTAKGRKAALQVVRKHRLWETFLFKVLQMPWTQIHHHACRLEHATDEQLAAMLEEYLGTPRFDPHGDPIPDAAGQIDEIDRLRLSSLAPGCATTVAQCTNENPRMLDYLNSLGLVPGARVEVLDKAPFNGPLTVLVDGRQHALGQDVAKSLIVHSECGGH